jgi:membrane-bound serine protease (ClpP class)
MCRGLLPLAFLALGAVGLAGASSPAGVPPDASAPAALPAGTASAAAPAAAPPALPATVGRCLLEGTVDAGSAAYLADCVRNAAERNLGALLVVVDTPGGSVESTREIVKAFLGAPVPVLVWVGPPGARAGSAGVFVTLASHVAGMAPGTNIGAAHPVVGPTGADPEQAAGEEMARKIENDTAAFAEAIARQRNRNVEWAVKAVRESESVAAERAKELGVIEFVAPTEAAFLAAADGRTVSLPGGERTLRTAGAAVVELAPTLPQRIVHALANPGMAYILFLLGALGIGVELTHPGLIVPGLVGVVAFILAMIGFSALPIQTGAVVLLVLGLGLLVGELFVASGLLGVGGVALLILGGVLLVDRVDPDWFVDPGFRVPLRVLVPTAVVVGGILAFVAHRVAQTRKVPQQLADLGLVGEVGTVRSVVGPEAGEIFVHGELWRARSPRPIDVGRRVVVRRVEGLTAHVEELSDG